MGSVFEGMDSREDVDDDAKNGSQRGKEAEAPTHWQERVSRSECGGGGGGRKCRHVVVLFIAVSMHFDFSAQT